MVKRALQMEFRIYISKLIIWVDYLSGPSLLLWALKRQKTFSGWDPEDTATAEALWNATERKSEWSQAWGVSFWCILAWDVRVPCESPGEGLREGRCPWMTTRKEGNQSHDFLKLDLPTVWKSWGWIIPRASRKAPNPADLLLFIHWDLPQVSDLRKLRDNCVLL